MYFTKFVGIATPYPIIYKYNDKYAANLYHYQGGLSKYGLRFVIWPEGVPMFNYDEYIRGQVSGCTRIK